MATHQMELREVTPADATEAALLTVLSASRYISMKYSARAACRLRPFPARWRCWN